MICKEVSYDRALDELANLLDSGTLSAEQRAEAQFAGPKAEKDMAYSLAVHLGRRPPHGRAGQAHMQALLRPSLSQTAKERRFGR